MARNIEPFDPDFPPIKVEPWGTLDEQHEAHVAWRQGMRKLTKRMRLTEPAVNGTRGGFFQRGMFIEGPVTRADVNRALDSR